MIDKILHLFAGGSNKIASYCFKPLFVKCGRSVHFSPLNSQFSYRTIAIGNDVYIGPKARFSAVKGLKIGNKVTFGPGVTIMGGNHILRK